jgi:trans-aconitate 2-methyltransferase
VRSTDYTNIAFRLEFLMAMGALTAKFFTHVEAAGFYATLLRDALDLLPDGDSRTLIDIGCGPGALTRLAAARGYHATGLDSDPAMIAQATRLARRERSSASFAVATLDHAARNAGQADVVSAASLLTVVPDPVVALRQLWSCVAPMGTLLVIETSQQMTPAHVRRLLATGLVDGPGRPFLALWARARNGRAIPRRLFDSLLPATPRHHPLLAGLVVATMIEKPANSSASPGPASSP